MDRIEALGTQLSQITMYDLKSMYNQAKNVVLNVSEMEAKVREATNDDPWGASSTLMQEIAQGTFNFQHFNEIMPCIYNRFMDKEARQWRQIYKALQLLEYLIKHGSERTVDDARSHLSTIKMLRNFHYIDEKGKDQGINVRNRAREIVELLSDLDKVRNERRKAKANKNKYTGVGNDGGLSFTSGGSRYGGFGSETLAASGSYDREYGGSSSNYGNGGSGGGGSSFRDDSGRKGYEEYDAGEDDHTGPRRSTSTPTSFSSSRRTTAPTPATTAAAAPPPKPKVPEVDLLGGFDDEPSVASDEKALPAATTVAGLDDDFGDFEAAPQSPAPTNTSTAKPNVFDLFGQGSSQAPSGTRPAAATPAQQTHNRQLSGGFTGFPSAAAAPLMSPAIAPQPARQPSYTSPTQSFSPLAASKPTSPSIGGPSKSAGGGFDDLWNLSLGSSSSAPKPSGSSGGSKSIMELEREKAQAGIWSGNSQSQTFGSFSSGANTTSSNNASSGFDDLLL
ncbi:ENTH-domain-containing protein [Sistotremastrum suecicum HHB10207 ss-3]|uniref:ENTH-domain-containing protein n=1 Tax=Sistotremastrum suecicum HHB10207 ss-3 TaxID=1314776 RepID=A0A166CDT2_9AGAM|nr:ENTH-domain-containing protein [Sistotremastrum suecicum HHB10207 ss-3]